MPIPESNLADEEPTSRIVWRGPAASPNVSNVNQTHPVREPRRADEVDQTCRELPAAVDFFSRIPRLAISVRDLSLLPLDHRDGYIVSLVDGASTVETILDTCALPFDEAIDSLTKLVERRILVIS